MKRFVLAIISLLLCVLLLPGCTKQKKDSSPAPENTSKDNVPEAPKDDSLSILKDWFEEDFTFKIKLEYNLFPLAGISQETLHEVASDGSFHSKTARRIWGTTSDSDECREYYYRYEDGALVCYMRIDDEAPTRTVLTSRDQQDIADSMALLASPDSFLPDYLRDFSDAGVDEETGLQFFTFTLPLREVYPDSTMPSRLVDYSYQFSGEKYNPLNKINIECKIELEQGSLRPVRVTYDFSELKPIVLTDGALSAEYALDIDIMYLIYEFDYEIPEMIAVPDSFIP